MTTSTIEFTVTLEVLDSSIKGIQESRKLLAGDTELAYEGETMLLSDALAEWLVQVLPQEVSAISATIDLKQSPLDDASGGGFGGAGEVGTPGKPLAASLRKTPRKATRSGSAKPLSAAN